MDIFAIEKQVTYLFGLMTGLSHGYICEALEYAALQKGAATAICAYRYEASATEHGEYFMLKFTIPEQKNGYTIKL